MNHNNNDNLERSPHFKDVFKTKNDQLNTNVVTSVDNDLNINTSESRRPSMAMITNVNVNVNSNVNVNVSVSNDIRKLSCINAENSNESIISVSDANSLSEDKNDIVASPTIDKKHSTKSPSLISKFQKLNIPSATTASNSKVSKKFRSKSLPNIHIPSRHSNKILLHLNNNKQNEIQHHSQGHSHHNHNHHHTHNRFPNQPGELPKPPKHASNHLLLPPVNLHSMHEIDLQEVLKNPQLRHDILFDSQLQFRPNLDGERGKRKKLQSENYWNMIKLETLNLLNNENVKLNENSPIIIMFQCLKSILISLIPSKDITFIDEILDMNLLIQQLNSKCFNFLNFSNWICSIFKLHCAPMRDPWVDELHKLFLQSENIDYLIEGFKTLFLILEAMKLDVANHQIRILRPLLCSSAVSFEKEYFTNAIKKNKVNFTSSLLWFKKNSIKLDSTDTKEILNYSILNLLSCSNMTRSFPNILNFDHTRLLLLRADIRHIVCIKLCFILYKTLVHQYKLDTSLLKEENISTFKTEILNIIIDNSGNSKWTKNLKNLSIQMVNKLFGKLDSDKIDFANNWLLTQTQPNSKVYKLLESKIFENILSHLSTSDKSNSKVGDDIIINDEIVNVIDRLNQLIEFNHNVFSEIYSSYLN